MIPKDFRDRILEGIHKQIRLNYRKWLVYGKEIDMFEILGMLIIYCRCDLNTRRAVAAADVAAQVHARSMPCKWPKSGATDRGWNLTEL